MSPEKLEAYVLQNIPYTRLHHTRYEPGGRVHDAYELVLASKKKKKKTATIAFQAPKEGGDLINYRITQAPETDKVFLRDLIRASKEIARGFDGKQLVLQEPYVVHLRRNAKFTFDVLEQEGLRQNTGVFQYSL